MIRFRFGHDDLLRTRFALSPLCEVVWSTHVLRDPACHSLHLPWVRAAKERLEGLDWGLLDVLANRSSYGYVPDFISPPPSTPLPDVADELATVRATPPGQMAREVHLRFEGEPVPDVVRPLLDEPQQALHMLADVMTAYWERAIAPWWPAIRGALEADILHRSRLLTTAGTGSVFDDLHPEVRWRGGVLEVDRRGGYSQDVALGGRGLLLVPAAFAWPAAFCFTDEPWQPAIVYTPRGIGDLWEPSTGADGAPAMAALLGGRRAAILTALEAPATTGELAGRLGASPAGVSEHLGVLRRAGLVRATRDGRHVRYVRTPAGSLLLRAPSAR